MTIKHNIHNVSIVMYHFIRELPYTRYPKIKGLLTSEFKNQLSYIEKHYEFVTMEDCIQAVYSDDAKSFPSNAVLLTFDDAYIDHYLTVFPILEAEKKSNKLWQTSSLKTDSSGKTELN